jgi:hypothetical protein
VFFDLMVEEAPVVIRFKLEIQVAPTAVGVLFAAMTIQILGRLAILIAGGTKPMPSRNSLVMLQATQ